MARFTLPRDLYHGPNALEALKTLPGKRAMICVGGGSMKRFGFLDRVEAYLKEAGMEVELFEGIEPDPSVTTVMKGAEAMLKFEPDWIIAMGGGSPIDAAKIMWVMYEHPEVDFQDMAMRFMDIRKRVYTFPKWAKKPISSPFRHRLVRAPKSRRLPSSPTNTRALNIPWPTTNSSPIWPSSIPIST